MARVPGAARPAVPKLKERAMKATEAVKLALSSTGDLMGFYLGDLSDADLLMRPVPGANHIAWQIGHLINSEKHLAVEELPDAAYPELPAGFADRHANQNAGAEATQGFATKAEYLDLFNRTRA